MAAFSSYSWNATCTGTGNDLGEYYVITGYRIVRSSNVDTYGPYSNYPVYQHRSKAQLKIIEQKNAERPKPTRRSFREPALYTCQRRAFARQYVDFLARQGSNCTVVAARKFNRKTKMGTGYKQKRRNYVVKLRRGIK